MNVAVTRSSALIVAAAASVAVSGCHAGGSGAGLSPLPAAKSLRAATFAHGRLGNVLNAKGGGQIFGFDIDRLGSDGVLAASRTTNKPGVYQVSVQTFDQDSGAITSSFANYTGTVNSYGADGIFYGDVGLITHYVVPKGQIYAKRYYEIMNPVTAQKFTGKWTPPIPDIDVLQSGVNQSTPESVLFAIELQNQDVPDLIVTDIAANTVSHVFHLDPNLFGGANGPQLAQYIAADKAYIAASPDGGTVGGQPPVNVQFDLKTGASTQFNGYNAGPFHAGAVNGAAVDPNTGIAATTTELNAQVEFYNLKKSTGITFVQLPCTGNADQTFSGAGIAADPVHKLFLVTEPSQGCGSGSALVVYDESGTLVESIAGFSFAIGEPPPVLNPSKRMGWAFGPKFSQLQQFFY